MQHRRIRHAVLRGQQVDPGKLERVREMRRSPTPAEAKLWEILRGRRFEGTKWRRQQVIGGFIVDFYCAEHRIVLEVDGGVHDSDQARQYDVERTVALTKLDIQVARITNDAVDLDMVRETLLPLVQQDSPPLP